MTTDGLRYYIVMACIALNILLVCINLYQGESAFESMTTMVLWLIYAECLTLGGKIS